MLCEPRVWRERDEAKKLLKLKKKICKNAKTTYRTRILRLNHRLMRNPTLSLPPSLITDSSVSVLGFAGQEGPSANFTIAASSAIDAGQDEHDRRRTRCTRCACNTVQMFVKEGRWGGRNWKERPGKRKKNNVSTPARKEQTHNRACNLC